VTDPLAFSRPQVVIGPRSLDGESVTSAVLDLIGYDAVEFLTYGGAWVTGAIAPILIQHGDQADGSDMADVPDTLLYKTEAGALVNAANQVGRVGYRARSGKRYVRVTITPTATLPRTAPTVRRCLDATSRFILGDYTSQIVDSNGFTFVDFPIAVGLASGVGPWTAVVQVEYGNASNLSDSSAVPDSLLDALESTLTWTSAEPNVVRRIGYYANGTGAKRYVRLHVTISGDADSDFGYASCAAELTNTPTTPGFGVTGLFRSLRTVTD